MLGNCSGLEVALLERLDELLGDGSVAVAFDEAANRAATNHEYSVLRGVWLVRLGVVDACLRLGHDLRPDPDDDVRAVLTDHAADARADNGGRDLVRHKAGVAGGLSGTDQSADVRRARGDREPELAVDGDAGTLSGAAVLKRDAEEQGLLCRPASGQARCSRSRTTRA